MYIKIKISTFVPTKTITNMEVKKIVCDCCGADNAKHYRTLAISRIEHTEGRAIDKPYVSEISVDLCDDCAMKATNIEDVSASYFKVRLAKN